jgi:hypothetical protein
MKKLLLLTLIITVALIACNKPSSTTSNYWHNKLEGKFWESAHLIQVTNNVDFIGYDLKLSCGRFTLIKRYYTDAGVDTINGDCSAKIDCHWEYATGSYTINEVNSTLAITGNYTKSDFIRQADGCRAHPNFTQVLRLSDYKSGVRFEFPIEAPYSYSENYLVNRGTADCGSF